MDKPLESALYDVLVTAGLPYATAIALVPDLARVATEHLASRVDLEDKPRLHRGASPAQRMTVDDLVARGVSERRMSALVHLDRLGPITCDRLEARTGLAHQSLSATLNWLERQGLAERDTSVTERTRRGGHASPYAITNKGRMLLHATRWWP